MACWRILLITYTMLWIDLSSFNDFHHSYLTWSSTLPSPSCCILFVIYHCYLTYYNRIWGAIYMPLGRGEQATRWEGTHTCWGLLWDSPLAWQRLLSLTRQWSIRYVKLTLIFRLLLPPSLPPFVPSSLFLVLLSFFSLSLSLALLSFLSLFLSLSLSSSFYHPFSAFPLSSILH